MSMKLAISGKGGTGKTTLAGVLARVYANEGHKVLAVDADPDANLASALGFPRQIGESLTPLAEIKELVEERTGVKLGSIGSFFVLNPRVDDIPDKYCVEHRGVKLLVLGTIKGGGTGCFCPENALLKSLLRHLLLERDEVVIVDMEAGIEHLGRGTALGVDALIVVVEPGQRSLQTAASIKKLAGDLGINRVLLVGNKIRGAYDREFILSHVPPGEMLGFISYSPLILQSDLEGKSPADVDPKVIKEVAKIRDRLENMINREQTR
jgi:CO dehydrogenase maturation factor